ncbi:MAG: LamG domain-containing protein [Tannerellaceae bacterium]|nr:LamG domain-containing protein [Tannerellaceae bacterium]
MRKRSLNKTRNSRVDCVALHSFDTLSSMDACGNSVSYYNGAAVSSGKFSNGLSGGVAYIHTANQADVYRKNFTIECWVRMFGATDKDVGLRINMKESIPSTLSQCQVGVNFAHDAAGDVTLLIGNSTQTGWSEATTTHMGILPVDNNFHHFAFVGTSNNVFGIFIDGKLTWISGSFSIPVSHSTNSVLYACANQSCIIDELRFTLSALYAADFTPPATPYVV